MTKPVEQSESHDASEDSVNGRAAAEIRGDGPRLRILLAEDGLVNQQVVLRLLRLRGHDVVVASDGRQAFEAWQSQPFDLVLMDVQMPQMDGYEATAAIRSAEQASDRHTPIIAMTADAMEDDRQRCLQAGMDLFISKPVDPQALFEVVSQIAGKRVAVPLRAGAPVNYSQGSSEGTAILDLDQALKNVGGSKEILRDTAKLFPAEIAKQMACLRQAVEKNDHQSLARAAHTLKSSVALFAADRATAAARRLEIMGRQGDWTDVQQACSDLQRELDRLSAAIGQLAK